MCSIALKKNDSWSIYGREYVDAGVSFSLSPAVSLAASDVDTNAQSAMGVGGTTGGIAFLSNGTLYSRAQTQLKLTSMSTGRTCIITISPNGGVTLQQ